MRWSSRKTDGVIAVTITGVFTLLFLFFIRVITISSSNFNLTLNDIIPVMDFSPKEPYSDVAINRDNQNPATLDSNQIKSQETAGNGRVQYDYYYIIIGSFRNLMLAQQESEKLTGDLNANIIILPPTKESLYRISYGKYSTHEEAIATTKSVRKTIKSDAWILSVKE